MSQEKQRLRILLQDRQTAYRKLFSQDDLNNPDPVKKLVIEDLEKFCRARESTFHPDARVAAALDGRREVVLRIQDYLVLSLDELCNKYGGK